MNFCTKAKKTTLKASLIIFAVIIVANSISLVLTNPDPIFMRSGISNAEKFEVSKFYIQENGLEDNDGKTKQPLSTQAADQIIHGELPLWNHYEGAGGPLLGETQSAAFSPFILLFLLPKIGWLLFNLILEFIAGLGMYLFLRRFPLKNKKYLSNKVATTGGCLYALSPVFVMLPNATMNPIPFFPWQLLGVLIIYQTLSGQSKNYIKNKNFFQKITYKNNLKGILLLSVSLILSLLAGFPEAAYLNGLFVFTFSIMLLIKLKQEKLFFVICHIFSLFITVIVCAPYIGEFLQIINSKYGFTGAREIGSIAQTTVAYNNVHTYFNQFIAHSTGCTWASECAPTVTPWFTLSLLFLSIIVIFRKNIFLWTKILFLTWLILGWMRYIGISFILEMVDKIPLISSITMNRLLTPLLYALLIILSCLAIEEINVKENYLNKKTIIGIFSFIGLFFTWMLLGSTNLIYEFIANYGSFGKAWSIFFISFSFLFIIAIFIILLLRVKRTTLILSFFLVFQSVILFSAPQIGATIRGSDSIDEKPVSFLQENLSNQRFFSNTLKANYGSYYNIATIQYDDIPIPRNLYNLMIEYKMTSSGQGLYDGTKSLDFQATEESINKYKELGIKYLFLKKETISKTIVKKENLKLVYSDEKYEIFENSGYKEYLSGSNCSVNSAPDRKRFDLFEINCKSGSSLTRLEINYPGWHAYIDGKEAPIDNSGTFQKVNVSSGYHTLEFKYWPKYMTVTLVLSGLGIFILLFISIFICIKSKRIII